LSDYVTSLSLSGWTIHFAPLRSGVREARQRDSEARKMVQGPNALRAFGFHGRDEDED
jgi:hypothetical protein